jgi:pyruvate ferredoxin oxidoreductase beta subunit
MVKTKELVELELVNRPIERGNLACPGCQLNLAFKHSLAALNNNAIVVVPACCTSVIQGAGDGYGMNVPIFNTAFASAPPVASGIARKLKQDDSDTTVVVWAGDGGSADIGLAALSAAAERNEDILYIMYDNSGYQNTGNQKSGSTPRGAITTTTPFGKKNRRKDVARMMIAQEVAYVATANAAHPQDLFDKISRAANEFKGQFRFVQIFSPCPPGWTTDTRDIVEVGELANETGFWISYEAVHGVIEVSRTSRRFEDKTKRKPLIDFLKLQGRFNQNDEEAIMMMEEDIDKDWKWLKRFSSPL